MKYLITLPLIALAACSSPRVSDYADAGSTAAFLSAGHVEVNPVIGAAGDAAPVAALGMKVVARSVIDQIEDEDQRQAAHENMDTVNWAVTCNNLALAAFNPEIATRLLVGLGCAVAHRYSLGIE